MIDSTGKLQKVVVVGSGDKAHGLANMYECHANKGLYDLVFTEPLPKKFAPFNNHVSVAPYPDALNDADIVVLAIPSYALETFLVQNYSLLQENCTIVDLTNASRDKKDLKETLKILGIDHDHWAKAFNDTGALQELQHRSTSKAKLSTNVCGPNEESVEKIVEFARALGYEATNAPYDQYDKLRLNQNTIGWEWVHATIFMLIVFVLVFIYVTVQVSGRKNFEWYTLMCRYTNKMFAWTCVYGFAFSLLPGTMIRLMHVFSSTPASKFLIWGCNIRKHVGLISLYFLFLHLCMAVLLFGGEYFGFLLREGHMEWNDEASMLTAVLSTSLFIITGIASLPSVNQAMNKAQFALLFGPVVWGALALGLMHIMFLGVPSWTEKPRSPYTWTRGMPPVTLMASVFPLFVMFIKVTQIVLTRAVTLKKMLSVSQKSVHSSDTDSLGQPQKNVVHFR